jgi:hypothetical protein
MAYKKSNANGQATMANSEPVVIASDQSAVPVSGTVTSNLGTLNGAATSAKQDTIIGHVDGLEALLTTIDGDTGTLASAVYTDAASSPANPTGLMPVFNNSGSIAAVSDAVGLPVSQIGPVTVQSINSDVSVTQSGAWSVTANAGTNLNTSALALDAHLTDKSQFTKITDGTDTALVTAAGEQNVIATAQPGVDIGDVTINNAAGASAVNVQDGGNSLTVDYATTGSGTAAGALRVELPTNGTGVVGLNAGTNAIGKLAANSGVDIGDVDVTSVPTDPFGTNADAASATGSISAKLRSIAGTGIPITGTVTVGSHAVTNAGTFAVQESGTQVQVDDAAFTPATSKVMMAGFEADESSTDSVDEGDGGAARMTLDRKVITTLYPHTAGGLSTFMASGSDGSSILVATAQAIKASAGQMYGYYAYNPEAAVTFVHFYNTAAASVTVGTTNPLFTIQIPPASAANLTMPYGITFSNAGWSCAATTTAGGNTAPSTGVSLTVWYA